MKSTCYLTALALFGLAASSQAVTINITGATAFRAETLTAIRTAFAAGGTFKAAYDKAPASYTGSTTSIFSGTFGSGGPVCVVRCTFSGSVEGVRSIAGGSVVDTAKPNYFKLSALPGSGEAQVSTSGNTETTTDVGDDVSHFAFSDVSKFSTPFASSTLEVSTSGAPVGVIVFTMLTNNASGITNVTSQQYRALFTQGYQQKSLFTGLLADDSNTVFATGRNDLSGTRTTALAETGFGITKPVNQFVVVSPSLVTSSPNSNPPAGDVAILQLVPQNGTVSTVSTNANTPSNIWGTAKVGNGGYKSGGTLASDMTRLMTSVSVVDDSGVGAGSEFYNGPLDLITWIGLPDALTARNAVGGTTTGGTTPAKVIGYNGVTLSGFAASSGSLFAANSGLTQTDVKKITYGMYTAWGYENWYSRSGYSTNGDYGTVFTAIFNGVEAGINTANATNGAVAVALTAMHASRSTDGGLVAPKLSPF